SGNDCKIFNIACHDRSRADNRAVADPPTARQDRRPAADPDIIANDQRIIGVELDGILIDEIEVAVIKERMLGQRIGGMIAAKYQQIAAERAIGADNGSGRKDARIETGTVAVAPDGHAVILLHDGAARLRMENAAFKPVAKRETKTAEDAIFIGGENPG